jgi:putative heme-binding domain-containing protein
VREVMMRTTIPLIALLGSGLAAAQTNPFAGDPKAAEAGRGTFRIYCSPCHGIRAQGGRGPDLTTGTFSAGEQDADLFKTISEGVPGTEMADFGERLGGDVVWRLIAYIRSTTQRPAAQPAGSAASGEALFRGKGGCGSCHQVGLRGGRLGPDLSRAGRSRSAAYLRESVVAPNVDLTPGYTTLRVVLRDGKEIVGVQRALDNFSAQLMDPAENFHSYYRSDVSSIRREFRSLMPDDYGRRFSASEIDDLVAYLLTLRGEKNR